MVTTYSICPESGSAELAIGRTLGQHHIAPLIDGLITRRQSLAQSVGELVVLDMSRIGAATSSYVRTTVLWLLQAGRLYATGTDDAPFDADTWEAVPLNIFPVVTGLTEELRHEIDVVLTHDRFPCMEVAEPPTANRIRTAVLRGKIEKTAADTLGKLEGTSAVSAAELHTRYPEERINVTGWSNRLVDLYRLRLARRTRDGKQWLYESVAEEIEHG